MPNLKIPESDLRIFKKLESVGGDEFESAISKLDPYILYDPLEFLNDEAFNGEFSNGLKISDALVVLKRAVHSASAYSMDSKELISQIYSSIGGLNESINQEEVSPKIDLAYSRFIYSARAEEVISSEGNTLESFQVSETIKPVFDIDDNLLGTTLSTTIKFEYSNDDSEKSISLNIRHDDLEFLYYSIANSLKRKGIIYKIHKSRGERIFSVPGEEEFYEAEG